MARLGRGFRIVGVGAIALLAFGATTVVSFSGSAGAVSKHSYDQRADAICKAAGRKLDTTSATTNRQEARIAARNLSVLSTMLKKLSALPKPKATAAALTKLYRAAAASERTVRKLVSALKASHMKQFKTDDALEKKEGEAVSTEFAALGMATCATPYPSGTSSSSGSSSASGTSSNQSVTLLNESAQSTHLNPESFMFETERTWTLHWSFDCSGWNSIAGTSARQDYFSVGIDAYRTLTTTPTPKNPTGSGVTLNPHFNDRGPQVRGKVSSSGTDHYTGTGTVDLTVTTPCAFKVTVTGPRSGASATGTTP